MVTNTALGIQKNPQIHENIHLKFREYIEFQPQSIDNLKGNTKKIMNISKGKRNKDS